MKYNTQLVSVLAVFAALLLAGCVDATFHFKDVLVEAQLTKVEYHPSHPGMVYGPYFNMDGEVKFGYHLGTVPAKYKTEFLILSNEHTFSTTSAETCMQLLKVPAGTRVNLNMRNTFKTVHEEGKEDVTSLVSTELLTVSVRQD